MASIPGLSGLQTQPEVQDHSAQCAGQCGTVSAALTNSCATAGTTDVSWSSSCRWAKQITLSRQRFTTNDYQCQYTIYMIDSYNRTVVLLTIGIYIYHQI